MNENLNLVEILKGCPKGTKLYSSVLGEVELEGVIDSVTYPIIVKLNEGQFGERIIETFTSDGRLIATYKGECVLFPSRYQRDWSKFKPKKDWFVPPCEFKDGDVLATEATIDGNKITPPENYLIGKITKVDNGMIREFVKKQPQYPKTYEECCEILDICSGETLQYGDLSIASHYEFNLCMLLDDFRKLLICRDAYWEIAGKQMGLDKSWEPDWLNTEQDKFVLYTHDNAICLNCFVLGHNVLAFPTEEMRDAFLENFKDLIESCKKLL